MNKREFLKTSGAFVAAGMLPRFASAEVMGGGVAQTAGVPRTNWAGNFTYHTDNLLQPKTVADVRQAVLACKQVRALGSRHSFNGIADSTQNQISLKGLDAMTLDEQAHTVTVGAGVTYGALSPWLDARGYALHNLASLPHISVMGAVATGTHGSGPRNGNLSTAVTALEMVTADGKVVTLSREKDGDSFPGSVVNLGALGIVTHVTLRVQPTFQMKQVVYENMSMDVLQHDLEAVFASGYSTSLFTDWQNHRISQVWIKSRVEAADPKTPAPEFHGATLQKRKLHPLAGHDPESCTEQQGIPGPWYERMPHFKMNFTPSSGQEIQSEYFVPRSRGYEAVLAVEELRDRITPHLFITELRAVAADDLWMSEACHRESMAIHFTWKPEPDAVNAVLPLIEAKLEPFDARPHWGKVFTMRPARLRSLYAKLPEFQNLLRQHDPSGKFRNEFLNANLFRA
jgi:xylitol oxidase